MLAAAAVSLALGLVPGPPLAGALDRRALLGASTAALVPALLSGLPRPARAVNFDPDTYGDKELKIATVNKLRQDIRNECGRDLTLLVPLLQLSLSDAFSYAGGAGGIDGSILLEMGRPSSAGLEKAAACVRRVHSAMQRTTEVSYADVVAFAGAAAIEAVGGPKISVQLGRKDVTAPGPEGAREGFSWAAPTVRGLRAMGSGAALTDEELVALVGALGSLELAARPMPAFLGEGDDDDDVDAAGKAAAAEVGGLDSDTMYGKKRSGAAKVTDNDYTAKQKLAVDVRVQKLGNQPMDATYFASLLDKSVPKTPFEAELLADAKLKPTIDKFSKSKVKFREALRSAYGRLQVLGGEYRGAAALLDDTADVL